MIATYADYGIWPVFPFKKTLDKQLDYREDGPVPDEIQMTQEQWDALLSAQVAKTEQKKTTVKPNRAKPAAKPYAEKSFVSVHYTANGQGDIDTIYSNRDALTYVVLHFYLRDGDTWSALLKDSRDYASMFPHCRIIAHDHKFNEPCSPAPKQRKCKEV